MPEDVIYGLLFAVLLDVAFQDGVRWFISFVRWVRPEKIEA